MTKEQLTLAIETMKEIDGIEMGVLKDSTPFLTGRSLAKLCGVVPSAVIGQKDSWGAGKRDNKLAQILLQQGYNEERLYAQQIKIGPADAYAYPDVVCMAFLEYYAFEAQQPIERAKANYRLLARSTLKRFIYDALGYDPDNRVSAKWRHYHDRMMLNSSPEGYFNIFKESGDYVIAAIRSGLPADESTIPDISIGKTWGGFWSDGQCDEKYGVRVRCEHNFPESFPQSKSNPQEIWAYPLDSLPEFRRWMARVYIPEKFPKYLEGKIAKGLITTSTAELILAEAKPRAPLALPPKGRK